MKSVLNGTLLVAFALFATPLLAVAAPCGSATYDPATQCCCCRSNNDCRVIDHSTNHSCIAECGPGVPTPGGTTTATPVNQGTAPPAATPAVQYGNSTLPGARNFHVVSKGTVRTVGCGNGSAHIGNPQVLGDLKIVCRDGRRWTLFCEPDGTHCAPSLTQFCTGPCAWNVGESCTNDSRPYFPNGNGN